MDFVKDKIKNLLDKSEQMIVPDYQRDFVWNEVEGREFFDDLDSSEKNKPLFIGTFIFNQKEDGEKIEIVDGQQRITTILIFLIACRVLAKEKNLDENFIFILNEYITLKPINLSEEIPCRLETDGRNGKIGQSLKIMSDLHWNGKYEKRMGSKHGWNKIQKPYDFFYKKLGECSDENLKELVEKLLNTDYISIIVENKIEAISTFEKVNARGQHLAVYDLIKAFLFSKKLKDEELENIEKDWEEIRKNIDENTDSKLKQMLFLFCFSKKGYVTRSHSQLYRKLKDMAESDTKRFVEELKSFSKFYSFLSSQKYFAKDVKKDFENDIETYLFYGMKLINTKIHDEDRIKRAVRSLFSISLFKADAVYPLIYSSLLSLSKICERSESDKKKEVDEWLLMLEFFENFIFTISRITHNNPKYGGTLQKLYSKYCTEFSDGEDDFIGTIRDLKNEFKKIKVTEVEFVEKFKEISYKNNNDKKIIYYIFDRLNNVDKNRKRVEPGNALPIFSSKVYKKMANNIEHIFPKNPQKDGDAENLPDNIDSIGNLLVLHKKDNSTLGNKSPKEKIEQLRKWIDDGTIQNKPYIEDFIEYYENECGGKWDEESIQKRTEHIAKKIYKIASYD